MKSFHRETVGRAQQHRTEVSRAALRYGHALSSIWPRQYRSVIRLLERSRIEGASHVWVRRRQPRFAGGHEYCHNSAVRVRQHFAIGAARTENGLSASTVPGRDLGGREFLDAWFTAEDGTQLHGWYSPHPRPRAVALFCHGNAGNLTHRSRTLRILRDRHDVAVLIFDYRGYGRSEGKPTESGLIQDAKAARRWLANHTDVEESDITLLGRSLGGGVAVQLAADDGARGLVLASTFTSLPDVGAEHAPLLAPKLVMRNRFDSITRIPEFAGPLLMSHGDADELIPFEQGRQLFEAARGPKRFIRIPDAEHNDPQPEAYREAFDQFLTDLPPLSRPPRM